MSPRRPTRAPRRGRFLTTGPTPQDDGPAVDAVADAATPIEPSAPPAATVVARQWFSQYEAARAGRTEHSGSLRRAVAETRVADSSRPSG